jgi:hypothetical protein
MHVLDDHVEAVITDDDVDAGWQLKDVEQTLRPHLGQVEKIGLQLAEALQAQLRCCRV